MTYFMLLRKPLFLHHFVERSLRQAGIYRVNQRSVLRRNDTRSFLIQSAAIVRSEENCSICHSERSFLRSEESIV